VKHWSLTTLRENYITIGAKVIAHARYAIFRMAEAAVPKRPFRAILTRIRRLRPLETVPGSRPEPSRQPHGPEATAMVCLCLVQTLECKASQHDYGPVAGKRALAEPGRVLQMTPNCRRIVRKTHDGRGRNASRKTSDSIIEKARD